MASSSSPSEAQIIKVGRGIIKTRVSVPTIADSLSLNLTIVDSIAQARAVAGRTYIQEGTLAPSVIKLDSTGALYTIDLQPGANGLIPKSDGSNVTWQTDDNSIAQSFFWASVTVTNSGDTVNNIASISPVYGHNHWPLNHRVHNIVKLSYLISNQGESVSAVIPWTAVPAHSSVILRFWPGTAPTFKLYAVPLSVGKSSPKVGRYGQLLATFATNISWSGDHPIVATLWLNPQ